MIRRLLALQWQERHLLVEATAELAVAALTVAFVPFRRIARRAASTSGIPANPATIAALRWAIGATARRVPWRAKCFEQGLAAHQMLKRRGLAATLHYGLTTTSGTGLVAHVWVRSGDLGVIGCENSDAYSELAAFSSRLPSEHPLPVRNPQARDRPAAVTTRLP